MKCGLQMIVSEDRGDRFRAMSGTVHSDVHDIWIDPNNTKHLIIGTDGGVYESFDRGQTFRMFMNLPLSQSNETLSAIRITNQNESARFGKGALVVNLTKTLQNEDSSTPGRHFLGFATGDPNNGGKATDKESNYHCEGASRISFWIRLLDDSTADKSQVIRLWNASGQPLQRLSGHEDGILALAFSPDGKTLLSGSKDGTARLWALDTIENTAKELLQMASHQGEVSALAFSPSGQPAISYCDLTNGDLKYAAFDGGSWVTATVDSVGGVGYHTSLAFSPSGQPAISYQDLTSGNLKYAERAPFFEP